MLPKKYRLSLRKELKRIKMNGKFYQGECINLLISPTIETKNSRIGIVVSSRIHKKAVKRNRIKRLLSEAINQLLLKIRSDFDIVIFARKKIIEKGLSEIKEEIEKLLRIGGVIY